MKKLLEGASFISAMCLVLVATIFFIFKIDRHKYKIKHRYHKEKQVDKAERKKDYIFEKHLEDLKKERAQDDEELENLRKLQDPIWNYYDEETDTTKVLPGKYGIDCPGRRPR